jgi:hypothetical protein
MYVKVTNGVVETYPYSIGQLRKDNRNVSFPANPSEQTLADWGVYLVASKNPPSFNYATHNCVRVNPILQNGIWTEAWEIIEIAEEEKQRRAFEKAEEVRQQRNTILSKTDWRFRSDMNPSQAWIDYCQALRDITNQDGFPWNVQWPVAPT